MGLSCLFYFPVFILEILPAYGRIAVALSPSRWAKPRTRLFFFLRSDLSKGRL